MVSLREWDYEKRSGLGGSGAWALLNGENGVDDELALGVGWQDPAVIKETGLCVWKSGLRPELDFKRNGEMLRGKMTIYWTGIEHDTPANAKLTRDYDQIETASKVAQKAILTESLSQLAEAINLSYEVQLQEGMEDLPEIENAIAKKYSGGGFGGYALYLFDNEADRDTALESHTQMRAIEPYCA